MNARLVTAALAASILAACSGGGASAPAAVPAAHAPASAARASLSIFVPRGGTAASARTPSYVSANATQLQVSNNGATVATVALGPNAPSCSGVAGGFACTAFLELPVGSDTIVATLLDPNNFALATSTIVQTIVAGQSNVINLTLNAVVSSVAIAPLSPVTQLGDGSYQLSVAGGSTTFGIALLDATGATIVGSATSTAQAGTPSSVTLLPGTCPLTVPASAISPQSQITLTPSAPFPACALQAQVNGTTIGVTPALSAM